MSNTRIQKKRAKREWKREKRQLIAQYLTIMYSGFSRRRQLQIAQSLWKLERGPLLDFLIREYVRRSPLRHIVPHPLSDTPAIDWRPTASMEAQ